MKLYTIAAIGKDRELGLNGDMPWKTSLKKDLAFFKAQTMDHPVVMGRKTFESIGRALPGRRNIVITSGSISEPSVETFPSFEAFLKACNNDDEEYYLIGGSSLYRQGLPYSSRLYLSEIDANFEHDCKFPEFNRQEYKKTVLQDVCENGLFYQHVLYERLNGSFCEAAKSQ